MKALLFSILLSTAVFVAAQEPVSSQFTLSEEFIREVWHYPVASVPLVIGTAGSVHAAKDDCELHLSAHWTDMGISDFPDVVLEPPGLCKNRDRTRSGWKAFYNSLTGQECTATGFLRVWPEHLESGREGSSNPNHFMEVHPLLSLACPGGVQDDHGQDLQAYPDLGYKEPELINAVFDNFKLWICKGCLSDSSQTDVISFDYYTCVLRKGKEQCGHKVGVPNFARIKATILPSTVRLVPAREHSEAFATAIARFAALDRAGTPADNASRTIKLYAIQDTDAYNKFEALKDQQKPAYDDLNLALLGILTVDPLAVVKALDLLGMEREKWQEVAYPTAFICFGTVAEPH